MKRITVVVGSLRGPKVEAARDAVAAFPGEFGSNPGIAALDVSSGVGHTPVSREQTMRGARNRAEELVRLAARDAEAWDYFVGLEGGLDVVVERGQRLVFLVNWAYVRDTRGKEAFGQSGAIALPEALAKRVVDEGVELAEAIDEFAGSRGIRDAQGAWGVLTGNRITRRESFRIALISAFASLLGKRI